MSETQKVASIGEDVEKLEASALLEMQSGVAAAENSVEVPQRIETELSRNPLTPFPSGYTEVKAGSEQGFAHVLHQGHSSISHRSQKVEITQITVKQQMILQTKCGLCALEDIGVFQSVGCV